MNVYVQQSPYLLLEASNRLKLIDPYNIFNLDISSSQLFAIKIRIINPNLDVHNRILFNIKIYNTLYCIECTALIGYFQDNVNGGALIRQIYAAVNELKDQMINDLFMLIQYIQIIDIIDSKNYLFSLKFIYYFFNNLIRSITKNVSLLKPLQRANLQ
ncbi:hypothetical protein pb186bvf_019078 [Paramecium bursaria]